VGFRLLPLDVVGKTALINDGEAYVYRKESLHAENIIWDASVKISVKY